MMISITEEEKAILDQLLNVASGDWFSKETLPSKIRNVRTAKKCVKSLINKIEAAKKRDEMLTWNSGNTANYLSFMAKGANAKR